MGNSKEDTVVRPGVRGAVITTAAALFFTPCTGLPDHHLGRAAPGSVPPELEGVGLGQTGGRQEMIHLDDSSQGKVTNFSEQGTFCFGLFLPSSPGEGMGG